MAEVIMPRLSDTMEEGSVQRWLKQPGDRVETGDIIAEIETDKAVMELPAFESGVLQDILVPEGQIVPIGRPIARIGAGAPAPGGVVGAGAPLADASDEARRAPPAAAAAREAASEAAASEAAASEAAAPPPPASTPTQPSVPPADGADRARSGRIVASPVARRVAEEWGIDLRQVHGTGPGGRILRENVEAFRAQSGRAEAPGAKPAAAAAAPPPGTAPPGARPPAAEEPAELMPLSRMRRAIARTMTESKPGVPHFYVISEIDMAEALALRAQINENGAADVKISVNDLVVKAVTKALRAFPALNSSYAVGADGQPGILRHESINLSIATALEDGLLAPVVRDADQKSLGTIAAEIQDLAARAREGRIRQNELEGATFQVSNLGMFDVFAFVSIITPPQAASLAVGSVRRVPVVREDGELGSGQMMYVILSADHRVTDGVTGARFLQEVKRLLQSPMRLLV